MLRPILITTFALLAIATTVAASPRVVLYQNTYQTTAAIDAEVIFLNPEIDYRDLILTAYSGETRITIARTDTPGTTHYVEFYGGGDQPGPNLVAGAQYTLAWEGYTFPVLSELPFGIRVTGVEVR